MSTTFKPLDQAVFNRFIENRVGVYDGNDAILFVEQELIFELRFEQFLYVSGAIPSIKQLVFKKCRFIEKVDINDYQKAGDITFQDCTFLKEVRVASLDNVIFLGINDLKDNLDVCTGDRNITIENIRFKRFIFVRGDGNLNIRNINEGTDELHGDIDLKNNFEIVIAEKVRASSLGIGYKSFIHELRINQCIFQRLDMTTIMIGSLCSISASKLDQLLIYEPQKPQTTLEIKSQSKIVLFKYHLASFENLLCQESALEHFEVFGKNSASSMVKLESVPIRNLVFRDSRNKGLLSFSQVDIGVGGSLSIKASDLGKTDFVQCEFSCAAFEFLNSKLMEAFMAETNFPRHVVFSGKVNHLQEQLAFGQISTAYQKQGDAVRALEYQAREIEAHYKTLIWFPDGIKSFSFTKFSLWLNKCSNDFGRNWGQGLLFSFGLGLVLYYLLIISSKEFHIGWPSIDGRLVSAFFKFMNPLRFFETENLFKANGDKPYLNLEPVSYFIDFIARIFVAYGYYQTIQAFRRYGRKY
jgi:hypothetical protein